MTSLADIDGFNDLMLDVEVELGRKSLTLARLLELDKNSLICLPRSAGENIDILIGGQVIARGELVMTDEAVSVRITDLQENQ